MLLPYCMTSFILDPSISFFIAYNLVIMTVICNIILTSSSKFQNKEKKKEKEKIEMRKKLKIIQVHHLQL